MLDLLSIFSRHELEEWRDAYAFAAAGALREEAVSLAESMDKRIASAVLKDIVLDPQAFLQKELAPAMEEAVLRLQNDLFAKAEEDYLRLVGSPLVWHREDHASSHEVAAFDGWQDVASAAMPLAVGGGVAAAIPFAAVSTSTALFGLITTTVVSWPIVVGGAAVAGTALATGVLNSARLADKLRARLRRQMRERINATFFTGGKRGKAVLAQIVEQLDRLVAEGRT